MIKLPFPIEKIDFDVLYKAIDANYALGLLTGITKMMPNKDIILNWITLNEAMKSSEIEGIFSSYDDIFKEKLFNHGDIKARLVLDYQKGIYFGFNKIKEEEMISKDMILDIHHLLEPDKGGIRTRPGTYIGNAYRVVYVPPQHYDEIVSLLTNFVDYFNSNDDLDILIKMAFSHFQFESIHPFYDGNGRTGRILNTLLLALASKIDCPIFYLSKYILDHQSEYYQNLQIIQKDIMNYKPYVNYILEGVIKTVKVTLKIINGFIDNINNCVDLIKEKLPSIYSNKLVHHLFFDFYTTNSLMCEKLGISRNTATKYLNELEEIGILIKEEVGKYRIYKNTFMYKLIGLTK